MLFIYFEMMLVKFLFYFIFLTYQKNLFQTFQIDEYIEFYELRDQFTQKINLFLIHEELMMVIVASISFLFIPLSFVSLISKF